MNNQWYENKDIRNNNKPTVTVVVKPLQYWSSLIIERYQHLNRFSQVDQI